jgi:hypothetical protein
MEERQREETGSVERSRLKNHERIDLRSFFCLLVGKQKKKLEGSGIISSQQKAR